MINNKGFIIIFIGIVLLLNTTELIPWTVWNIIIIFWPVLFIVLGIELLIEHIPFSGLLISLVTLLFLSFILIYSLSSVHRGVYEWTKRYIPWIVQSITIQPPKVRWYRL